MLKSGRQLRFLRLLLLSLGLAQRPACWSGGLEWPSPLPAWLQLCLCKHLLFKNYSCCLADSPCSHLSLPPLSLLSLPAVRMCRAAFCQEIKALLPSWRSPRWSPNCERRGIRACSSRIDKGVLLEGGKRINLASTLNTNNHVMKMN